MVNPRSGQSVAPTPLGGISVQVAADVDPRGKLVDWIVDPSNVLFSRALANRMWKHFLGRGLVEAEDDLRATNPPTNPELLDALAKHVVDAKFDLKALIRAICNSTTYQLTSNRTPSTAPTSKTTPASSRGACPRKCSTTPSTR